MEVGRSIPRVDAADKVTGRAKYTDDLCPRPVLEAKILHSTIANGWVKSMDISAAQALPGVVKVLTCFDVPDIQYPTPGHPWSVEKAHQDVSDRKLLNRRVRIYGDDIAAVVAEDEITARRALELIRVEYEEYPVVLEPEQAMAEGAPVLHEEHPDNILAKNGSPHAHAGVGLPQRGGRAGLPRLLPVPGTLRHPAGAALPHREPHLLRLDGGGAHRGGHLHPDPPHRPPGDRPGHGHRLGLHPGDQALHRRRLRQQAGGALRAPQRLAHHPGGGPVRPAGRVPGGDLPEHPLPPPHLLRRGGGGGRRHAPDGPLLHRRLQPGGLRLPRPLHRGQRRHRLPAALSGPDPATTPRPTPSTPTGPPPARCGATASPSAISPWSA